MSTTKTLISNRGGIHTRFADQRRLDLLPAPGRAHEAR